MIDLHIHTTSSDGSDEPKDILIKAQQSGLKYISITDHDSIGAYKKLRELKVNRYFEGNIIPGCEFSVVHNGKPIEVLGYGIDLDVIGSTGIVSDEKFFMVICEISIKMSKECFTTCFFYNISSFWYCGIIFCLIKKKWTIFIICASSIKCIETFPNVFSEMFFIFRIFPKIRMKYLCCKIFYILNW